MDGDSSFLEKHYNDYKKHYNKHYVQEILFQRAVKTTIQIIYDKGFFDSLPNADKKLKVFSFVTRRIPDLEELNENYVIQWFCS